MLTTTVILTGCKRKSFDEYLVEEAERFSQTQCPREIDNYTVIDSMKYDIESRTLNYYYTLKNELGKTKALTPAFIEDFQETMLISLRDDISLKKHKEDSITFSYHYRLKDSIGEAFCLKYTPKDYFGKLNLHTFNYREVRNLREYTKNNCPLRQDANTVLDSMWYDSISRTYYYDYSLEGELDNDSIYGANIARVLKKSLIDNDIVTERDKEKLNFGFRYFSSTTKKILIQQTIMNEEIK